MVYDIFKILESLPWVPIALLVLTLIISEVHALRSRVTEEPYTRDGSEGFLPPDGDGYEYCVSASNGVYILHRCGRVYRVYLIFGSISGVPLRRDRRGVYFIVRANNPSAVEIAVDRIFREERSRHG